MQLTNKINIILRFFKDIFTKEVRKKYYLIFILSTIKIFIVMIPAILTMKILDEAIPKNNFSYVLILAIGILTFTMLESLIDWILEFIYCKLGKCILVVFQNKCLNHIFRLSGDYYSKMSTGEVLTVIADDIEQIQSITSSVLFEFISNVIVAICMIFLLGYLQLKLLLIILCIIPTILFIQKYFQIKGSKKLEEVRDLYGKLTGLLENVISNIKSHVFINSNKYFFNKYQLVVNETKNKEIESHMIFTTNSGILSIMASLIEVCILGIGGIEVMRNNLSIGGLITFNIYTQKLIIPMLQVSSIIMQLERMIISIKRIYSLLDETSKIDLSKSVIKPKQIIGYVNFNNVSFSYKKNENILNDISFECAPNTLTAIVGESGIGKSTIVSLLYRLWDQDSGTIKIDNINIKEFDLIALRNNISIISQDVYLIDDTIYNNIALGKDNKSFEEIREVAKIACIDDFINSLEKGYNTFVGENGIRLSGGEKQRISIARQLLNNSPIIVFDEATSALDPITEHIIIDNIKNYLNDKTIIMITHRLSTIKYFDKIYVLEDKTIIESGTHDVLMDKKGTYYNLYKRNLQHNKTDNNEKVVL